MNTLKLWVHRSEWILCRVRGVCVFEQYARLRVRANVALGWSCRGEAMIELSVSGKFSLFALEPVFLDGLLHCFYLLRVQHITMNYIERVKLRF